MQGWRPLSLRGVSSSAEEALYEGTPPHLVQPLLHWLSCLFVVYAGRVDYEPQPAPDFVASEGRANRIAARARVDLRPVGVDIACADTMILYSGPPIWCAAKALLHVAGRADDLALLDTVDAALADGVTKEQARDLEQILTGAGSAWRVADNRASLERRVDPAAVEAYRRAATGNAAPHLNAAWTAAYGRHPDPSRAYSEAIKAVEAACIPVVEIPGKGMPTLGRVIIHLSDHSQDWHLAIKPRGIQADISTLLAMLRLLWQGQTDRHGGTGPTVPVTQTAAEGAVHLAITLVQWFQSQVVSTS